MSELRVQLHGYLPDLRPPRSRSHPGSLRALPQQPLDRSIQLALPDHHVLGVEGELALLIRLVVAGTLAALLGWERERARKSAGLRTHMLVGIASALFTVLAELAVLDYPRDAEGLRADPIRVIQAVAIGIGFLGSGVIFVSKSGETVKGLTTAGSIWATAAIGISAGLGYYVLAVGATLLLLGVLWGMARFDVEDAGR